MTFTLNVQQCVIYTSLYRIVPNRLQLADAKLPPTRESLKTIKPFKKTGTAIKDVHKTGLGSSAALITSLVAALLVHFEVFPASHLYNDATSTAAKDSRCLVHNLAQHVHCLAQGKVGSGFDVSAAVFGSQLYTRFSPSVLGPLMVDDLVGPMPFLHDDETDS
jgi:phosphomevalonate kinase